VPSIQIQGFTIAIRTDDHAPAHAHVIRYGANYRFYLLSDRKPEPVSGRMSAADVRRASRIIAENRAMLVALWRKYHRDE
jgi:hypothetical protein